MTSANGQKSSENGWWLIDEQSADERKASRIAFQLASGIILDAFQLNC